jgi:two-component system, NtrC family, response regulator AtoC
MPELVLSDIGQGFFMVSASSVMKTLEAVSTEVAATSIPVLILGESGTGKQVLARRIHEMSPRRAESLFRIFCGAVNPETLSSQLRLGDGAAHPAGTVILDGIDELDRECQRKLLHALPDGDTGPSNYLLAARVISTASQDLEDQIRGGRFRHDLYYRVNGVSLRIPPLRERREDIPLLAEFFLAKHSPRFERARPCLSEKTIARLTDHHWSGNVRELENVVLKILAIGDEEIALADLSGSRPISAPQKNAVDIRSLKAAARSASREAERELILKALERTKWNRKRAAQELQVSYKSLLYKLKQIGLPAPESE